MATRDVIKPTLHKESTGDGRAPAMELDAEQFRALGHVLVDRAADFLAGIRNAPAAHDVTPRQIRGVIGAPRPMPATGEDAATILRETTDAMFAHSTLNGHPRFFGYITSSAAPIGALGDLLGAVVNPNCGAWVLSPVASEIERESVRWIAELLGYPTDCGGLLVSGGNMANMVAFVAAVRATCGWDMRDDGAFGDDASKKTRIAVYASGETHTWIEKALDLYGFGQQARRRVATDAQGRMDPAALRDAIARDVKDGVKPSVVIATAGTVSTGVVDPIVEIAKVCREHKLWLHVDGAYGAPAACADDAPEDLRHLDLADSVAVDPHKWLYAPIEAGCTLVRNAEALHDAFVFHPPYYQFAGAEEDPPTNFHEWGPQNSRGARALKVWLTLRQSGKDGFAKAIGEDIALSRAMFEAAKAEPELEALTQSLSIATMRYVPRDVKLSSEQLDELNRTLLARLVAEGDVFLSNAIVDGKFALRACIVNFRTTLADVHRTIEVIVRTGRRVAAEMAQHGP